MVISYRIRGALRAGTIAGALLVASSCVEGQDGGSGVEIDADDIGGVVISAQGPEAGVWVVAETTDLPTRFIRIVATDDLGRYVLPDLPEATYEVFVRGYGLVDSPRVSASPGQMLDLKGVVAPDARAAAEVYPAAWWLSMVELPDGELSQQQLGSAVTGCLNCHQVGNKATREIPGSILRDADSHLEAWDRRVAMGPMGAAMSGAFRRLGDQRDMFADWTDRIASGEVPSQTPPRPTRVERNVVVTLWDWGTETDGRTDSAASDVRDATVNANGFVYGVVQPSDILAVLDPVEHRASVINIPSSGPEIQTSTPVSPYWGDDAVWARQSDPRSVAMDADGRVWLTGRIRGADAQPEFCTDESNAFADYYPLARGSRQVFMYDPGTEVFSEIDTCFSADHNQISDDDVIYYGFNGGLGWINIDIWDETQDAEAAQGWCPGVVDTNGDGLITPGWTEPDEAIDPTRDHRIQVSCYSPAVNPADGTVWCSGNGSADNKLVRIELGDDPPASLHGRGVRAAAERDEPVRVRQRWTPFHLRRHCLAGLARQRAFCVVRPEPVRRDDRSRGHRAKLSGRLDVSSDCHQTDLSERRVPDQLRRELSHADRPPRRPGSGSGCAALRRRQHRFARGVRPGHRAVHYAAGAVPDGLLLSVVERPN